MVINHYTMALSCFSQLKTRKNGMSHSMKSLSLVNAFGRYGKFS